MIRWLAVSLFCIAAVSADPLSITTSLGDGATFVEGDAMAFLVSNEQPGYLYLYLADAGGEVNRIFPNDADSENFIPASFYFQIPKINARYQFTASAPYGSETVIAILYEKKPDKNPSWGVDIHEFDSLLKMLGIPHERAESQFYVQEAVSKN